MNYDVFNGDADGLCAIRQLRLARPLTAIPITGLKRDNQLLQHIQPNSGDEITVADISIDTNRQYLEAILNVGAYVKWFDHHYQGDPIFHVNLDTYIEYVANTCSSLIVYDYLSRKGHQVEPGWALAGAFGDGMEQTALRFARKLPIDKRYSERKLDSLKELGVLLNYNSYGESVEDIHIHPRRLYGVMLSYTDPFDFIDSEPCIAAIRDTYQDDFGRAQTLKEKCTSSMGAIYELPDAAWARRISGTLGNYLFNKYPNRAHAVLVPLRNTTWRVSVRAPKVSIGYADELCRLFSGGGGRKSAGGIDALPDVMLDEFRDKFLLYKWKF